MIIRKKQGGLWGARSAPHLSRPTPQNKTADLERCGGDFVPGIWLNRGVSLVEHGGCQVSEDGRHNDGRPGRDVVAHFRILHGQNKAHEGNETECKEPERQEEDGFHK
jgi:hypothetical protein